MNNKEEQIKVYVMIGTIVMLLVIFSGITYAFFSASNNNGSTSLISATSGKMSISYADGKSDLLVSNDIQPSNAIIVNKTFTLTGSNTTVGMKTGDGLSMPYQVGVQYTSTFSDGMMHYYIKEVNRSANSQITANYVITPETGKTEDDYKNQTVPGNDTYTGYTHGTFKNGKKYTEMVTGEFPASLNDQTITFNLIIQFPDNGLNQDSEKGKTFNGKVVVNYKEPKTFAKDTWETIADNTSSDVYKVGDTKQVLIGNKPYTVRIANKSTPAECNRNDFSQTACGFVVEFADIVESRQMNSSQTNVGGWPASELRTYANGDFLNKLPSDLQKVIKATKVASGHGSSDKNANRTDGNWESTDKIYLFTRKEIHNVDSNDSTANNTRQLDYYNQIGVNSNTYLGAIKKNTGLASFWWLRGAHPNYDLYFLGVTDDGDWNSKDANHTGGFAPAFRIG